jgi:hypothetical protein
MLEEERRELVFLLKRCAANNRAAQEEFANRSFLNTIHRAVIGVIDAHGARNLFTPEDLHSLVVLCVWEGVYQRAEEIVKHSKTFRESLRHAAVAITTKYLNKKLAVR